MRSKKVKAKAIANNPNLEWIEEHPKLAGLILGALGLAIIFGTLVLIY